MKLKKDLQSIVINAEFGLAVIVMVLFLRNFGNVYFNSADRVHQFDSFQGLIESVISCNHSAGSVDKTQQGETHSNQPITFQSINTQQTKSNDTSQLPQCPIDKERFKYFNDYGLNSWLNYRHVQLGGKFKPIGCEPLQRVAVVVPYRNRREHLERFTLYMHQFLPNQLIEYTIYVIEQSDDKLFNRAKLFNVGVEEISKIDKYVCCFIFHDVDLLPLDQKNLYMCSSRPRHLSPSVNTLRFRLLYPSLFGGVISMTKVQYDQIGGFSNDIFGWGGEDDDIFRRIVEAGYGIDRTPKQHGVYTMMKHSKADPNPFRYQLLKNSGYNVRNEARGAAASRASYKVESINKEQLFTIISVRL